MSMAQQAGTADETALAPAAAEGSSFTLRDFLIATFFHIRVVMVAALVPLVIGIVAAALAKTEYTASSLLLVIVNREVSTSSNVTDSGPAVLTVEGLKQVESEVQIIESADVIRTTIEQIGMDRLFPPGLLTPVTRWLNSDQDEMDLAIERFRKNLRATVVADSNIMEVQFTNPDREIAIKTTDALVQNYLASRRKVFENPTAKILMLEVERFKRDLTTADNDIEALKAKVGVIDFNQDAILASNQMDSVVQRIRQVDERDATLGAQLKEAEAQRKALPDSVFDFSEKTDALSGDDSTNLLTGLLLERDRLAAQYAPGSPLLKEVQKKIDTMRKRVADRGQNPYYTDRASRNPSINYVDNLILNLKVEKDSLGRQRAELEEQRVAAQQRINTLRGAETRLIELTRQRETLSEGYREYLRRAVAANIEETAARTRQSNVRLVQEAGAAVTKRSLLLPMLAGGLLGGILFGAAAGAIASVLRTTFIMPSEPERLLGLPNLATFDDGAEHRTNAAVDQAIGSCATLLLDTRIDDQPLRAMHFLTAEREETLPWFCRRLAEEFATQRRMRTLLVDLSSRMPYPLHTGHAEVIGGLAVTTTPVPLLWAAADVDTSPLLSVRLPVVEGEEMMKALKSSFDCIVICSSLQGSSLVTQRLTQLVDGNILAVHAEITRKPAAMHLSETVAEAGGTLLGLIFFGRRYYLPNWLYRRA
ncbi:exopolysaccharide transport family protein [Xanthobacter variabilis]|uniref:exopolysaccharide transport family protein n=1 Tax=Xanthobacter variabilis TaxID=3119932 RepID=UPI00374EF3BF